MHGSPLSRFHSSKRAATSCLGGQLTPRRAANGPAMLVRAHASAAVAAKRPSISLTLFTATNAAARSDTGCPSAGTGPTQVQGVLPLSVARIRNCISGDTCLYRTAGTSKRGTGSPAMSNCLPAVRSLEGLQIFAGDCPGRLATSSARDQGSRDNHTRTVPNSSALSFPSFR